MHAEVEAGVIKYNDAGTVALARDDRHLVLLFMFVY